VSAENNLEIRMFEILEISILEISILEISILESNLKFSRNLKGRSGMGMLIRI
jgi:hypothetical protein